MPSPVKDALLGRTIAQRYRLISRLGAGSAASVYLARHVLIERLSAIKIVHPELARDALWRERFLREARAVNRINHPNIVEITDLGEADGLLFLVMEYVPGESLRQVLERGPLGWRRAAEVGLQVAGALGRAHQMGVVHRGLDASNVLLVLRKEGADSVKLTDFGVAKLADAAPLTIRVPSTPGVPNLRDLDARSDLFDLGALLYEATTGKAPPPGGIVGAFDAALTTQTPAYFAEVVSTMLAPDVDERPRDGFEAADLLARAIERGGGFNTTEAALRPSWMSLVSIGSNPPTSDSSAPEPRSTPPPSVPPSRRAGPVGLVGASVEELAGLCASRIGAVEEEAALLPEIEASLYEELRDARRLSITVGVLSELVQSDTKTLEAVLARGRAARAELGRRLDEAAREHSRTLGWAGTIAERSYHVEVERLSGGHPVPTMEAMVWEQAALEQEEDAARDRAARLLAEMDAQRDEIETHHERHEHELRVAGACVEGRVAALRAVAAEAWSAIEDAGSRVARARATEGGTS